MFVCLGLLFASFRLVSSGVFFFFFFQRSERQIALREAMSGGRDWHVFLEALELMEGQAGAAAQKRLEGGKRVFFKTRFESEAFG